MLNNETFLAKCHFETVENERLKLNFDVFFGDFDEAVMNKARTITRF